MKLIKLSEEHYIVVDDSEIIDGDWMIRNGEQPILVTPNFWWDFGVPYKKITHSTQPLYKNDFWAIQELKLSEVKELLGEVDVETKARNWSTRQTTRSTDYWRSMVSTYVEAYNECLEDNKEKKYTERDLWRAFDSGKAGKMALQFYETLFQPKTEWEVEIVDGKLKLKQ